MSAGKRTTNNLVPPGRRRQRKSRSRAPIDVPVPERLHDAIEKERGNLLKADSLLGCLVIAMEYETDSVSGPHYPDVAQIARELVKKSIDGLDSLTLQQLILRGKVKEEFCLISLKPTHMTHELPSLQWREVSPVPTTRSRKSRTLRLHRRNYHRVRTA
jgi:hypothetical protein